MPTVIFPSAYNKMIDEDIEWLKENSPPSVLYRNHIIEVLEQSKDTYKEEYPKLQMRRIRGDDKCHMKSNNSSEKLNDK